MLLWTKTILPTFISGLCLGMEFHQKSTGTKNLKIEQHWLTASNFFNDAKIDIKFITRPSLILSETYYSNKFSIFIKLPTSIPFGYNSSGYKFP